jgi:hypothetical protein
MKKALLAIFSVVLIAASAYLAYAGATAGANLSGTQEVGGGGDPDGSGQASVKFGPSDNNLCVAIYVDKISTPTEIDICRGAAGTNGTVVASYHTSDAGCLSVDPALGRDIKQHPENYYVNVLNADYPSGAIRGQLAH